MSASSSGDRREQLYDAAVELFYFNGYGGTSVRDIADAVGVNVATMYHYFKNKQALLIEVMSRALGDLLAQGERVVTAGRPPAAQLYALALMHVEFHLERAWEVAICDREVNSLPMPARAREVGIRDRYEAIWTGTLEAGVACGAFDVEDVSVARFAMLSMLSDMPRWYRSDGRLPPAAVARQYARFALGIAQGRPNPDNPSPNA